MKVLSLIIVVCVNSLGEARTREGYGNALESLTCDKEVEYYPGVIVDIETSVNNGAKLLKGTWDMTSENCVAKCCTTQDCDLAVFKSTGVSSHGHNCYLVECGSMANCVMVPLTSFVSMTFKNHNSHSPSQEEVVPTTKSPDFTTKSPDFTTNKSPESGIKVVHTKPSISQQPTSFSTTITLPSETTNGDGDKSTFLPKTHQIESSATSHSETEKTTPISSSLANGTAKGQADASEEVLDTVEGDRCGLYGCDGSGVVAVVVVAAVCCSIVIVVAAVLMKKVFQDKRRKRFQNVDYLINGMYT